MRMTVLAGFGGLAAALLACLGAAPDAAAQAAAVISAHEPWSFGRAIAWIFEQQRAFHGI